METNAAGTGPYLQPNNSASKNSSHHLWQQMNQMPKF